ncbi:MAG: M23 family metallopeptidase [Synechococcales bacterium]|nr:M23 family metallopeptidase [Synechococcales bacterium]
MNRIRFVFATASCLGLLGLPLSGNAAAGSTDWSGDWASSTSLSSAAILLAPAAQVAQTKQTAAICPEPALSQVIRHRVAAGETLEAIATRYDLLPTTLLGFNPALRSGSLSPGTEVQIPPYNGIRVNAPAGATWQDLADTYNVRADVLFEINGCPDAPSVVFVPGVNWSPAGGAAPSASTAQRTVLQGYPLPSVASVTLGYGWQVDPVEGDVEFHSGIDLEAVQGTPISAVGSGVVAFAGEQGSYGNLVVINHPQGLQTRYAQLADIAVQVGQSVNMGDVIGTAGTTGLSYAPHLHFEVRSNSEMGWVAQDPAMYVENLREYNW